MTNLPPIPKDRNWSPETWRAGLDEAVRRDASTSFETWEQYQSLYAEALQNAVIAHATTLLNAGIVKSVVSEAVAIWDEAYFKFHSGRFVRRDAAIAVIQSALDKARAWG